MAAAAIDGGLAEGLAESQSGHRAGPVAAATTGWFDRRPWTPERIPSRCRERGSSRRTAARRGRHGADPAAQATLLVGTGQSTRLLTENVVKGCAPSQSRTFGNRSTTHGLPEGKRPKIN